MVFNPFVYIYLIVTLHTIITLKYSEKYLKIYKSFLRYHGILDISLFMSQNFDSGDAKKIKTHGAV